MGDPKDGATAARALIAAGRQHDANLRALLDGYAAALDEVDRLRAAQAASVPRVRAAVWHAVRHFTELDDSKTGAIADRVVSQLGGASKECACCDYIVMVCASCRCASCWHGEFLCHASATAATVDVRASELRSEQREHQSHFSVSKIREVCGTVRYVP